MSFSLEGAEKSLQEPGLKRQPIRRRFVSFVGLTCILFFLIAGLVSAGEQTPVIPDLGAPPVTADFPANQPEIAFGATAGAPQNHTDFAVYLPLALNNTGLPALSVEAATLAGLAASHSQQRRASMISDPILTQVANDRARDMAQRSYFNHVTPDGLGPNYLVRQAGYALPNWYGDTPDANNIESIAAGFTTAQAVWNAWLNSPGHRAHVLGEIDFWAEQTYYGIGYYYDANSPYKQYWVFLSAPPER